MDEVEVEQSVGEILNSLIKILIADLKRRRSKMREGLFHGIVLHKSGILESLMNVNRKVYDKIKKDADVIAYVDSIDDFDIKLKKLTDDEADKAERYLLCKLLPNDYKITHDMEVSEEECFLRRTEIVYNSEPSYGYSNRIMKRDDLFLPVDDHFGIIETDWAGLGYDNDGCASLYGLYNEDGNLRKWHLNLNDIERAIETVLAFSVVDFMM